MKVNTHAHSRMPDSRGWGERSSKFMNRVVDQNKYFAVMSYGTKTANQAERIASSDFNAGVPYKRSVNKRLGPLCSGMALLDES